MCSRSNEAFREHVTSAEIAASRAAAGQGCFGVRYSARLNRTAAAGARRRAGAAVINAAAAASATATIVAWRSDDDLVVLMLVHVCEQFLEGLRPARKVGERGPRKDRRAQKRGGRECGKSRSNSFHARPPAPVSGEIRRLLLRYSTVRAAMHQDCPLVLAAE